MKNLNKLFLVLILGLLVSCDDKLDINRNPNYPLEINAGLALTSAEANLAAVMGGEWMNLGGFYAQYHTQAPSASQFENIDSYNLNTIYANTPYTQLYAGTLTDLKFVTDESAAVNDTGTMLIAEALRAYTFQILVDLFGDVPYTEAVNGTEGTFTPTATPGAEIYADLIVKLDAAVAAYEANPTEAQVGVQDVIYNGNIDRWIQFINTLKLKMYIRMAYTPQANPAAVNALIAENNFLTEDATFATFDRSANKRNPFFEVFLSQTGLGDVNHIASNTLFEFYNENEDPRLNAVYRSNLSGNYAAIEQGTGNTFNNTATAYARPNIRPRTPVFLLTVTESNFLQAEALIRYSGGAGAKEKYDEGVLASLTLYQTYFFVNDNNEEETEAVWTPAQTVSFAQILTEPGGAYEYVASANVETAVRQVAIQKWAALPYVNNVESYIETTRTKYPEVVPVGTQDYSIGNRVPSALSVLAGTQVPSILFYPDDEVTRNPNITQHTSLTQNVWWDQKPE